MKKSNFSSVKSVFFNATMLITAAIFTQGCGNKDEKDVASTTAKAHEKSAAANLNKIIEAARPKGDKNHPLENYRTIDSGNQIMFLYYAIRNLPIDYESISSKYSSEYRSTSDSFKKQDLLNAMKPRIDSEIANARSNPYVRINVNSARISEYDFNKKGFRVDEFSSDGLSRYYSDNSTFSMAYINPSDVAILKVEDEQKARLIEGMRSNGSRLELRVYCFAQDTDLNRNLLKLQILKYQLIGPAGELLAEFQQKSD